MQTQSESKDVVSLAREIFLDDPSMSAATVLQILGEHYGVRAPLAQLEQLHGTIVSSIARGLDANALAAPYRFANRPRIITAKRETMAIGDLKKNRPLVDVVEKRKFLNDWALERGGMATIKEAKEALQEKFGEALGTTYIANTLREAKQLVLDDMRKKRQTEPSAVAPEQPEPTNGLREAVRRIVELMKICGVRRIEVKQDGTVDFDAAITL